MWCGVKRGAGSVREVGKEGEGERVPQGGGKREK